MSTTESFVEYQLSFRGANLRIAGRPDVTSDQAIISMIFQREMFAIGKWAQAQALDRYLAAQRSQGGKPLLVDAGANIGVASLYFNALYPGMRTIAIEPDAQNARLAAHNLRQVEAQIVQGALGKDVGTMFINDVDFGPIAYRVAETGSKAVSSHTVQSILDGVANEGLFPFILKIDIEGGEEIVFSADDCSWLDRFPLVIIELHDWMLPFQNSSRNFFRHISKYSFDLLSEGENTFCFNTRLLGAYR